MQSRCHGITGQTLRNPLMSCHSIYTTPHASTSTDPTLTSMEYRIRITVHSLPAVLQPVTGSPCGSSRPRTRRHTLTSCTTGGGSSLHQGQEPVGGTLLTFIPSNGRSSFCKVAAASRSSIALCMQAGLQDSVLSWLFPACVLAAIVGPHSSLQMSSVSDSIVWPTQRDVAPIPHIGPISVGHDL
jgi:hypothetical protein